MLLAGVLSNAYFYVAVGFSAFFILQSIFTFIGIGEDFELDADFDAELDLDVDREMNKKIKEIFKFKEAFNLKNRYLLYLPIADARGSADAKQKEYALIEKLVQFCSEKKIEFIIKIK